VARLRCDPGDSEAILITDDDSQNRGAVIDPRLVALVTRLEERRVEVFVREPPASFHIDELDVLALPAGETPGVTRIDPVRGRIEIGL
jgi:hypothetical protein